jgi:hypothetical protein
MMHASGCLLLNQVAGVYSSDLILYPASWITSQYFPLTTVVLLCYFKNHEETRRDRPP